jgi:hypothetical protein
MADLFKPSKMDLGQLTDQVLDKLPGGATIKDALSIAQTLQEKDDRLITSGQTEANVTNKGEPKENTRVNIITRRNGFGTFDSAMTMAYYGHNHQSIGNAIPINTDHYGYVFFTRPRMNLSYDNITSDRVFTPMLAQEDASVWRAVRAYLDPVGSRRKGGYPSRLVDDLNPFIPILSNTLISLTGFPDPYVDTYTSKAGLYKEEWFMVDGFPKIYNTFDVTANFRNIVNDPISFMFHIWTQYAALVHEGKFDPYSDMVIENEIDYQTRIWRLVMDKTKKYVQKIGACGAAAPTTDSLGAAFNYNESKPYNDEIDQISVTFKCAGAMYMDPILVKEFNDVVQMFNIGMLDELRSTYYTKVPDAYKPLFNNSGYPRIDPKTMELEWWIRTEDFKLIADLDGAL